MVSTDERQRVSPWMDTVEAARYLGAQPGTLKNWRHRGEGPKYHVINRRLVRYHQTELDVFAGHDAPALMTATVQDRHNAKPHRAD